MLIPLFLSLFAQAPVAPANPLSGFEDPSGGEVGNASIEAFEKPVVAAFQKLTISGDVLDETSIAADGQGPNLVLDGCEYITSPGGFFQSNGEGYFGSQTRTLLGAPSSSMTIQYEYTQEFVQFELSALDGHPDTATVIAYDTRNDVVDMLSNIDLPNAATRVPVCLFGFTRGGRDIIRVEIIGSGSWPWSPLIDNHVYSPNWGGAYEGFQRATIPLGSMMQPSGPNREVLDDSTILANGEGPSMVGSGAVYSCPTTIQWNAQDFFGQNSQTILANTNPMVIDYEHDQEIVEFTLNALKGFPETATVTSFDRMGNVVEMKSNITLPPDASKVTVNLNRQLYDGIARVEVTGATNSWSPCLDGHYYYNGPIAFEKFELHPISSGGYLGLSLPTLDSNTVDSKGNGPGLVKGGVTYSATGGSDLLWGSWYAGSAYGKRTKFLTTASDSSIIIDYAIQQPQVRFTLSAYYDFMPDVATCYAYDSLGNVVDSVVGLSLPDAREVPVTLNGPNIAKVEIFGSTIFGRSPCLDNHDYIDESPLHLDISGSCPGSNAIIITGGTPGKTCKIMYSTSNTGSILTTGGCIGFWTDLGSPVRFVPTTYTFNSAGEVNFFRNIPSGACGRIYVQVIDEDCQLSNVFKF